MGAAKPFPAARRVYLRRGAAKAHAGSPTMMGRPFAVVALSMVALAIALPSFDAEMPVPSTTSDSFVTKAAGNLDRLIKEESSEGLMPKKAAKAPPVPAAHPPKKQPDAFQDDPLSASVLTVADSYEENKASTKHMMATFKKASQDLQEELSNGAVHAEQELAAVPKDEPMPPPSVLVDDTASNSPGPPEFSPPITEGIAGSADQATDAIVAEIAGESPSSVGEAETEAEAAGSSIAAAAAATPAPTHAAAAASTAATSQAAQNVAQSSPTLTTAAPTPAPTQTG